MPDMTIHLGRNGFAGEDDDWEDWVDFVTSEIQDYADDDCVIYVYERDSDDNQEDKFEGGSEAERDGLVEALQLLYISFCEEPPESE